MKNSYQEYPPSPALAPLVECYWSRTEGRGPATPLPAHTVLPDGCMDIVFNFGSAWSNGETEGNRRDSGPRGGAVVGTMTAPLLVTPGAREDFFGVRFRPGMARAFLPPPASEFTDAAVALGEVWGRTGLCVEEQLAARQDSHFRIAALERELLRRLPQARAMEPCVSAALDVILRHRGAITMRDTCRYADVTRQHLARRFAQYVGISPKRFSRVVRFQHLLACLRSPRPLSWSRVAADLGYYDQPHLIADFREFAGCTPEKFLASRPEQ